MANKLNSRLALILLALGFLAFMALNSLLFGSLRLDLTENGLYSVSKGTQQILDNIDEPINLHFYFSDRATKDLAPLRTYARRVRELLEELALRSDGKLTLSVVDPAPFSEAEDQAAAFGLQSVPVSMGGEQIYFGLAGTNAYDDVEVISFFQPDREEFLEYEIAKLVQSLVQVDKPVIGLLSGIEIAGGYDMMSQRPRPAWTIVEQARQSFEIREIQSDATTIADDISELMIVHPAELSREMEFAIDQFVMRGGRALVFVDPYAESAQAGGDPMTGAAPGATASSLPDLFKAWGIEMTAGKVLADRGGALLINAVQGAAPVPHLAYTALSPANISDDIISNGLEAVNVGAAGVLQPLAEASTTFQPILQSSEQSGLLDAFKVQMNRDPRELLKGFVPDGKRYTVAARLSGPAKSAFDGPIKEGGKFLAQSDNINVIAVADVDLLADRFWVQVSEFFGQRLATAWADNGSLVLNALENLSGSDALISIRSRGRYSRPFTVVQGLRAAAEERNQATADRLQQKLDETERRLAELQQNKEEQNLLVLSPEQEVAVEQFQQEKLDIRKRLREVRHQLDEDIEQLGTRLKLLNVVVMPLLLTLALWFVQGLLRRRDDPSREVNA